MPRTMQECHALGGHAHYPRERCLDCRRDAAEQAALTSDPQCSKCGQPVGNCYCTASAFVEDK